MTNSNQDKVSDPAAPKSRLGHWMRVAVMILSGGFIYPNAMSDDVVENDVSKDSISKE